jgi:ABC-type antimicrobial peptide transport system permease subunit
MQLQHIALLAETGGDAAATIRTIRDEVAALLPEVEIQSAAHVRDLIDRSLGVNRLVAAGSIVFAAVAILLAALGLYAMVAHGLERRRREIGIRMALGATSARVAMESVRPIGVVYAAGVCLGSLLLLSTRSAIQSVMVPPPGVAYPPLVIVAGTAAALLLAVLVVACYRPVKSAAGSDPAVSLRID